MRAWANVAPRGTARRGAHRKVLVEGAQPCPQVVWCELALAVHVEEVEGGVELVLVDREGARAAIALELVLAQTDDRLGRLLLASGS